MAGTRKSNLVKLIKAHNSRRVHVRKATDVGKKLRFRLSEGDLELDIL